MDDSSYDDRDLNDDNDDEIEINYNNNNDNIPNSILLTSKENDDDNNNNNNEDEIEISLNEDSNINSSIDSNSNRGGGGLIHRIRYSRASVLISISMALFTDMVCYGIVLPILPDELEHKYNASQTVTGLLFASYSAGSILFTPIFGLLTDRIGRKTPFLMGMVSLCLATLLFAFGDHLAILFVARFAQGVSAAVTWVVGLALIADIYPPAQLGTKIGSVIGGNAIGALVGPIIGGITYQHFGYRVPFFIATAFAVTDLLIRILLVSDHAIHLHKLERESIVQKDLLKQQQQQESENIAIINPPKSFYRSILSPSAILILLGVVACSMGFGSLEPVLPVFINKKFGGSSTVVSLLFATMTAPFLLFSPLAGWISDRKLGHLNTQLVGMSILIVFYPFIDVVPKLWQVFMVILAISLGLTILNTPLLAMLTMTLDPKSNGTNNGKIFSLFNMCYCFGVFIGPIIGSAITDHLSLLAFTIIFPVLCLILLIIYIIYFKFILPPHFTSRPNSSNNINEPTDQQPLTSNIQ